MRALLLSLLALLLLAAPAAAAPTWLPPETDDTGLTAQPSGDVAVTPDGTAVAAWIARVGGSDRVRARVRLPGRGFGPVRTLTPADGSNAADVHVAVDGLGNATLAWQEQQGPGGVLAIRATRVPAGADDVEAVATVSTPGNPSSFPALAVGAGGTAVIAYTEIGATSQVLAVARAGAAGAFGAPDDVSETFANAVAGNDAAQTVAGVDDDGDAIVAWKRIAAGNPVIEANFRPRNGAFGSVTLDVKTLSNGITAVELPALAIAPDGTTVVMWSQGTPSVVQYNERTPANVWLPDSKTASPPGVTAFAPAVAMDGSGNAIAAWNANTMAASFIQAGLRPAGGAFGGDFRDLTSTSGFNLHVVMNRAGDALVTFSGSMSEVIGTVFRPRGGSFSGVIPAESRNAVTTSLGNQGVGMDDQGNATGLWYRNLDPAGTNTHDVVTAAFDAAPPTLSASVPPGGTARASIGMAAAAVDRLSPVSIAWAFGDGGSAFGGAVTHAFGAPGAYNVTVVATDSVGNAASTTRPVQVRAAPRPRRIDSSVGTRWAFDKKRVYLLRMKVNAPPKGAKAELRCSGKKCAFKRRKAGKIRKKALTLFKTMKAVRASKTKSRTFRPGQTLQLRITASGFTGKVVKYRIKRGKIPVGKVLCLPQGAKKPKKC